MEVPYHRIKGRGDIYLVVNEKGTWRGAFQCAFYGYYLCESKNWNIIFSTKQGIREFTQNENYFLETKKAIHSEKYGTSRFTYNSMRFTTEIMDLL